MELNRKKSRTGQKVEYIIMLCDEMFYSYHERTLASIFLTKELLGRKLTGYFITQNFSMGERAFETTYNIAHSFFTTENNLLALKSIRLSFIKEFYSKELYTRVITEEIKGLAA